MKKRGLKFLSLAILTIFLIGSCDSPFLYGNLFGEAGLGQPTQEELAAQAQSDKPEEAQPAIALIVENDLQESGAAPVISGLVDVLLSGAETGEEPDFESLLDLIPDGVLEEENGVANLIDSIIAAQTDLDALAASIDENDGFVAEGVDTQTLAMTAVLGAVLSNMDTVDDSQSVGEALQAFMDDSAAGLSVSIDSYVTLPSDFGALIEADETINTLLLAAGFDPSMFSGSGS